MRKRSVVALLLFPLVASAILPAFSQVASFPNSAYGRVEVSADGNAVATWPYEDDTIHVWDTDTQTPRGGVRPPTEHNAIRLSTDGKTVVTWYSRHDREMAETLSVWDVGTGKQRFTLAGHTARIQDVAFSANDTTLVSCSKDDTARVWELATGKEINRLNLPPTKPSWRSLAASPDGKHVVIVNHEAASPDGNGVKFVDEENKSIWWEVATGQTRALVVEEKRRVGRVTFSPDSRTFAARIEKYGPAQIRLYDVATGRQCEFEAPYTRLMTFSPDGRTLALVDCTEVISLRDVATGKQTGYFDRGSDDSEDDGSRPNLPFPDRLTRLTLSGAELAIIAIAFRPNGELFAFGRSKTEVLKWRVTTVPQRE